jgi:hypothetical protein
MAIPLAADDPHHTAELESRHRPVRVKAILIG